MQKLFKKLTVIFTLITLLISTNGIKLVNAMSSGDNLKQGNNEACCPGRFGGNLCTEEWTSVGYGETYGPYVLLHSYSGNIEYYNKFQDNTTKVVCFVVDVAMVFIPLPKTVVIGIISATFLNNVLYDYNANRPQTGYYKVFVYGSGRKTKTVTKFYSDKDFNNLIKLITTYSSY